MEILGILGFVFAATALGVLVYEHQTDVLHGPYIEGRSRPRRVASAFALPPSLCELRRIGRASAEKAITDPARALASALIVRLNWNTQQVVYLASLL